jgi:DNA mismatch repair ATPase MutS
MNSKESDLKNESREIYLSRLIEKLNSKKNSLQQLSNRYSKIRLLIFVMEVILFFSLFFFDSNLSAFISFIFFLVVFSVAVHLHNKLDYDIKKFALWIKLKSTHLARLNLDWQNIPKINYFDDVSLSQKFDPVELDLNLAGEESLHQLINTGTSKQSKSLLRNWLRIKNPAADEINTRQQLVKELTPLTRFRDKLTLNSILSCRIDFDGEMLLKLLNKKDALTVSFRIIFVILIILAPINILLFVLFLENLMPAYWGITTLTYIALFHFGNKEKDRMLDEAEYISDELKKISSVLEFLESYNYKTDSKLSRMCEPFINFSQKPSILLKRIKNSIDLLRIRKGNPFVWNIIRAVFPVDFFFRLKLHNYKKLVSENINIWLETWYNLEALSSLATFVFLNPEYNFPEITKYGNSEIMFRGKALGHPLIKKENKIRNDFIFNTNGEISIVTGSNMSGKSTFIRTLGVNLSLAYAGSVVNAESLNVSLFRLYTCIKVSDSVIDGISYFYAEVKRLKKLLDEIETSGFPVFFLIDEIFRGTNNVERLKGSSAFIKKLAETNAVGVLATHDLELVKLADVISKVKNYHFKEEIKNNKMFFDYMLNEGPCPTTNALKIMKLEGLPIE